jgi:hypothetical protein
MDDNDEIVRFALTVNLTEKMSRELLLEALYASIDGMLRGGKHTGEVRNREHAVTGTWEMTWEAAQKN